MGHRQTESPLGGKAGHSRRPSANDPLRRAGGRWLGQEQRVEMVITPDGHLLGRCDGEASFKAFLGASEDLLRNIHGVAPVAELDGDELG